MATFTQERQRAAVVPGLLTLWIVGGLTYPALTVLAPILGAFGATAIRCLGGGALLLLFRLLQRNRMWLSRKQWMLAIGVGIILYPVGMTLLAVASEYLPSAMLAVGFAMLPVVLMAWNWFDGQRPSLITISGLLVAIIGLIIAVGWTAPEDPRSWIGWLLLGGSIFSWAIGLRLWQHHSQGAEPLTSATVQLLAGGVVSILIALAVGEPNGVPVGAAAIWLGVFIVSQALLQAIYVSLSAHVKPVLLTTFTLVNPLVAAIAGWMFLKEDLSIASMVGGLAIIAGASLVLRAERQTTNATT
jgi:drug/metabolite transporter (DMT)-like permease